LRSYRATRRRQWQQNTAMRLVKEKHYGAEDDPAPAKSFMRCLIRNAVGYTQN
jgi:hypothetical protein